MKAKIVKALLSSWLLAALPAAAQSLLQSQGAISAASGPSLEMNAGYNLVAMSAPGSGHVLLNGIEAGTSWRLNGRWSAIADSTFAFAPNALSIGHSTTLIAGMVGPGVYVYEHGKTSVFARGLVGASWVDSAVPVDGTYYLGGYVARFTYAAGGGVERPISPRLGLRLQADYLRTAFADKSANIQGLSNIRVATSLVYRIGGR